MTSYTSVKERMKIFTDMQPVERDQLQESVVVTVATTVTQRVKDDKVNSSRAFAEDDEEEEEEEEQEESVTEQSSDQYTEDDLDEQEEQDDEENEIEQNSTRAERLEERIQVIETERQRDSRRSTCNCEICMKHRANCKEGECECFGGRVDKSKLDKSTSTPAATTNDQGTVAPYRPFILQSPFNFAMGYMARSAFACKQEVQAQVIGDQLPSWLNGSLLRLGPAKWDLKASDAPNEATFTLNNWFDGCAMLAKYRIDDGKVYFSSKFIHSNAYKKMKKHGKPIYTEFGTRGHVDPDKNVLTRLIDTLTPSEVTDNTLSNVYEVAGEVYTASDTSSICLIDVDSLSVKCKMNTDKLNKLTMCTSHPHLSLSDGCMYNISCCYLSGIKYHVVKIPVKSSDVMKKTFTCCGRNSPVDTFSQASICSSFTSSYKNAFSLTHSFFITQKYIVFVEHPLLVNAHKLATCASKGKAITDCLEWHANSPVKFILIDKKLGFVSKVSFITDTFFFLHTINSYEATVDHDDTCQPRHYIVADIIIYESPAVLEKYNISKMRNNVWNDSCQPQPTRFILPLDDLTLYPNGHNLINLPGTRCTAVKVNDDHVFLKGEPLSPPGLENARINYPRFNGQAYQFMYGTGGFNRGVFSNSLCKLDVNSKTPLIWKPGSETAFPSDVIFVPHPHAVDEDDGILLSVVIDANISEETPHFLVVLDAKTMREIARAQFNQEKVHIAASTHGLFVKTKAK